jgi:hypothetical protein
MEMAVRLVASFFRAEIAGGAYCLRVLLVKWPLALAPALLAFLLPAVLGYRRAAMARAGTALAVFFVFLIPFERVSPTMARWDPTIHAALLGVLSIYALVGIALCGVGIYDGKRTAVWALLAVLSLIAGAMGDTLAGLAGASSLLSIPAGFLGFWLFLGIGSVCRRVDITATPDVRELRDIPLKNQTRRSRNIPRKLLREGNAQLLPLFFLLNRSDLGREGIENSGSYRFADHLYRNQPSGRGAFGRWLDARLLCSPPARAFRRRHLRCVEEMRRALESFPDDVNPLRVLAVPCGLPRELMVLAEILQRESPELLARVEYHGLDLDGELLKLAERFTATTPVPVMRFHHGNALRAETFPPGAYHCVVSTGLNEFLERSELQVFFGNVFRRLAPGGTFYTSATQEEPRSDALMRAFELITRYHSADDLERILRQLPWSRLQLIPDESGLQIFVIGVK